MKEFLEYIKSVGALLIATPKGVIVNHSDVSKVDLAKINELVPEGWFVNPHVLPSAVTIANCLKAGKDVPSASIGVFKGKPQLSIEDHCAGLED